MHHLRYFTPFVSLLFASSLFAQTTEYLPGIEWPEPPVVTPSDNGSDPPSDAIVLFAGKDLSAWDGADNWKVAGGAMIAGQGNIKTKQKFGDCQLHIEWSAPQPRPKQEGQQRGNSGIFLMDAYELQVLDSYKSKTYPDGQAGSIYKQTPPMVNAMRAPGEWNVYDVAWTAPRFKEDGSLESPARITVFQNGVLVLNGFELKGGTFWNEPAHYEKHDAKMPIQLQDHGNPVKFRNIWVREVAPIEGKQVKEPSYVDHSTGKKWNASEDKPTD
jgi:hypothetical protein